MRWPGDAIRDAKEKIRTCSSATTLRTRIRASTARGQPQQADDLRGGRGPQHFIGHREDATFSGIITLLGGRCRLCRARADQLHIKSLIER